MLVVRSPRRITTSSRSNGIEEWGWTPRCLRACFGTATVTFLGGRPSPCSARDVCRVSTEPSPYPRSTAAQNASGAGERCPTEYTPRSTRSSRPSVTHREITGPVTPQANSCAVVTFPHCLPAFAVMHG
jgi:hypothetical protein